MSNPRWIDVERPALPRRWAEMPEVDDITGILEAWHRGEPGALDRLLPRVYHELRRLASHHLRFEERQTLHTTALVHEAYVRLLDQERVSWQGRSHFYGIAAQAMRRILVDHARHRRAAKRGRQRTVSLDAGGLDVALEQPAALLAVDEALRALTDLDPRQGRLVELRFFGGLTIAETAETLDVSPATVKREWRLAKAWLQRALAAERPP